MKSEHRHELQKNELAARLEGLVDWSKRNAQLLAGILVGAMLTLGVYFFLKHRWQEGAVAGWNEFFSAANRNDTIQLESLAVRDSGELPGQMANLLLADTSFNSGVDLMNTDRTAAEEQLNLAKNKYSAIRSGSSDPLVKQRATLGLARFYEAIGLIDEAVQEYQTLAKDWADGPYADLAAEKITYLNEPSTRAFAKWYLEHKPLPPASPLGTAGSPIFTDINQLPPNEKSFPQTPSGTAVPSATPSATATPTTSATPSATAAPSATATPSATGTGK